MCIGEDFGGGAEAFMEKGIDNTSMNDIAGLGIVRLLCMCILKIRKNL